MLPRLPLPECCLYSVAASCWADAAKGAGALAALHRAVPPPPAAAALSQPSPQPSTQPAKPAHEPPVGASEEKEEEKGTTCEQLQVCGEEPGFDLWGDDVDIAAGHEADLFADDDDDDDDESAGQAGGGSASGGDQSRALSFAGAVQQRKMAAII
eukprot:SAG22_NODE_8439_length_656_cov_1.078995_1_plen_155_part_00